MIGLIYSAYSLAMAISNPIAGRMSDKIGRKNALLLGLLGSTVGFTMLGITIASGWSLPVFLTFRFLSGAFGSTPPVAKAYIADVYPLKERPVAYALFGATLGGSFAVGPAIGGALSKVTILYHTPFLSLSLSLSSLSD
jgi:MFS family permease